MSLQSFPAPSLRQRLRSYLKMRLPAGLSLYQLYQYVRQEHEYKDVSDTISDMLKNGECRVFSQVFYYHDRNP